MSGAGPWLREQTRRVCRVRVPVLVQAILGLWGAVGGWEKPSEPLRTQGHQGHGPGRAVRPISLRSRLKLGNMEHRVTPRTQAPAGGAGPFTTASPVGQSHSHRPVPRHAPLIEAGELGTQDPGHGRHH